MTQSTQKKPVVAIITMFFIFAMISFVTNMAAPFGNIWGFRYAWAGMAGNLMNFTAYLFMGIPAGNMLIKYGYKKTTLIALAVGAIGLGIQLLSSIVGDNVIVIGGENPTTLNLFIYLLGALVCGVCVCMLNTVVNPMLNLLGGGGNKGNQLIQTGGALNSLSGTLTPMFVGVLVGTLTKETTMASVASSSCGVDLFAHIRFLLFTTVPSMAIALAVFLAEGVFRDTTSASGGGLDILASLHSAFRITPWVLLVPAVTIGMIAMRVKTVVTLAVSSALGAVAMLLFQPQIPLDAEFFRSLWSGAEFHTSDERLNALVSTSGFLGMLPTIMLVTSAMVFGGVMIGTGMLSSISRGITARLSGRRSVVGATVGSGLLLNGFTADQYLSIIIGANMYKAVYERTGLAPRVLSRTLEDSVSVTSVLIPWNSCGLTQSAVLGVPTLVYLPYCVFNYLSPVMSFLVSAGIIGVGSRIRSMVRRTA